MKKFSSILVIAMSVILAAGCGGKDKAVEVSVDKAPGARLLAYVPADTPYIFASLAPYPEGLIEKLEPLGNQVGDMMNETTGMLESSSDAGVSKDALQALSVLYQVVRPDTMKEFGLSYNSTTVFYGNGLLPVMRTVLEKPDLFAPRFKKMAAELELDVKVAKAGSMDYQSIAVGDGANVLVAQDDDMLVVAFAPAAFEADNVAVLLGASKPATSMAKASDLATLAEKYDYLSQGLGYIDLGRIANVFLDGPKGLNAALFDGENPADGLDAVCRSEIKALTMVMPRLALGYTEVSGDSFSMLPVMELRQDIAAALRPVAASVPGMGEPSDGLVKFGFGIDLKGLRGFVEEKVGSVVEKPYQCPQLATLNDFAQQLMQTTKQPLPPLAYNFKGFFIDVDNVEGVDFNNPGVPESLDMSFLLAFDNVDGLLQMGQMFLPPLAMLEMTTDGKAAQLPQDMLQGYDAPTFAAMTDNLLAVSTGDSAKSNAESLAGQSAGGEPMLMAMSVDMGAYMNFIADMQESVLKDEDFLDDNGSEKDAAAAKRYMDQSSKLMKAYGEIFDRENVTVVVTDNGIEMPTEITFK